MIANKDMSDWETIFAHVDDDTGEHTNIAVGRLFPEVVAQIAFGKLDIALVPVEEKIAAYFRTHRGVEDARLQRLSDDFKAYDPIMFACMPDGTHLLVDGHHRYVKAAALGAEHIKAVLVPEPIWREFQIAGLEPVSSKALRAMWSGIV